MNLGQLIGELMFARESQRELSRVKRAPVKRVSKRELILTALRARPHTLEELHQAVGGSKASLSVYLCTLKKAEEIVVSGGRLNCKYSAVEK